MHNLQPLNYLHNADTLRQLVRVYSEGGKIDSVNEISFPKGQNHSMSKKPSTQSRRTSDNMVRM